MDSGPALPRGGVLLGSPLREVCHIVAQSVKQPVIKGLYRVIGD